MFAKLLKHDILAVLKYWWIGAVVSVGCAILCGFAGLVAFTDNTEYTAISDVAYEAYLFCFLGVIMLPLFTYILLLVRYQKHFFSDEGYLTFTLPVKKSTLIDSKLTLALIFSVVSSLITLMNFMVIDFICGKDVFDMLFDEVIKELNEYLVGYTVAYVIMAVIAFCLVELCYITLMYVCLTISSLLFKKYKVIAGLAMYSVVMWFVYVIGVVVFLNFVFGMYDNTTDLTVYLTPQTGLVIVLGVIGVSVIVFGVLYYILTAVLHKKLNLA